MPWRLKLSVPVGTSVYALVWVFGRKSLASLVQATGETDVQVRVGQWPLCSQALLLPPGVPPVAAQACFTQSLAQGRGFWRGLTTPDVGDGTEGQGVPDRRV